MTKDDRKNYGRKTCIRCGVPNGGIHTCLRNLGQTVTPRNN